MSANIQFNKVEVRLYAPTDPRNKLLVNGHEIKGIQRLDIESAVGQVPTVTLTFLADEITSVSADKE